MSDRDPDHGHPAARPLAWSATVLAAAMAVGATARLTAVGPGRSGGMWWGLVGAAAFLCVGAGVVVIAFAAARRHPRHPVAGADVPLPDRDRYDRRAPERAERHSDAHDPLTGLPNRALLGEQVARALAARRRASGQVALLVCAPDRRADDPAAGHEVGDVRLAEMARRLLRAVRVSDTVARLDGEAFAVLCTDLDTPIEAELVAERLLATITASFELPGRTLNQTASIGVATAGPDTTAETLLHEAGSALHAAMRAGRGRVAIHEQARQREASRRRTVGSELHRAVRDGDLRVYYQPIVAIQDGRVVAAEALVRWQHPQLGLLVPPAFLDVAEQSDLVCEIDAWVAAQATRDAVRWPPADGADIDLHLNLSPRHLASQGSAPALVGSCLQDSGLAATRLVLELAETSMRTVGDGGRDDVESMRALGVRFAADDFGVGYDQLLDRLLDRVLDELVDVPLDMVKVDRELVARLDVDARARAVVERVATRGRSLRLAVVAEGVERREQQLLLAGYGVPAYQGFLHAPAVDVTTLHGILAAS